MSGAGGSQEQGAAFERSFEQLIGRLLTTDLSATVTENRIQPGGSQFGKDIQTRWREPDGREFFWQFECKSHRSGTLPSKEVADKLLDVMKSSHQIDVWCLVLAHIEPGVWIDETLAWCREQLQLPFEVAVLSRRQNDLEGLFECEQDLLLATYPDHSPRKRAVRRVDRVEAFKAFLHETTDRASTKLDNAWQLVAPNRMDSIDDPEQAAAYLKGLCATAPWQVASGGWATPRTSATRPLVERILDRAPGFDFCWLVGAGGEGKSTVMRQVAWEIAHHDDWVVLWTAAELRENDAIVPDRLLAAVGEGGNVLLCIDDSERLSQAAKLRAAGAELASEGKRVFLLVADRGAVWNRSTLPSRLQRGLPHRDRKIDLPSLSSEEAEDLVARLDDRSLLARGRAESIKLLRPPRSTDRTWLLPTLMQLTDPEERGFEGILASVLGGLKELGSAGPIMLLLATSLVQSSGNTLSVPLATRLLEGDGGLQTSLDDLTGELERQFGVRSLGAAGGGGRLVTHHRIIAEGFLRIAGSDSLFFGRLLEVCEALPTAVAPDVTPEELIPKPLFQILDAALRALLANEPPLYEAADYFLRSLTRIDNRQFPALTRLGDCDADWLRAELAAGDPEERAGALADSARNAYREALNVAERVLGDRVTCPAPYRKYELDHEHGLIRHAWGVLEDTAGHGLADEAALRRSTMLFLQTIDSRGLSTLAMPLIHLGRWKMAARAVAGFRAHAHSRSEKSFVRNQERLLHDEGHAVAKAGIEVLDALVPEIISSLLWPDPEAVLLYPDRETHRQALLDALRRTASLVDRSDQIDLMIAALSEDE